MKRNPRSKRRNRNKNQGYMPSIVCGVLCLLVALGILFFPNNMDNTNQIVLSEFSSVNTICELATLKSFYHNVAMYEKEPEGSDSFVNNILLWPFGGFVKTGYKQFWLEYSGIVETGIDASQIQINKPSVDGKVDVYVPDAKVLSVYADESSLSEPLTETGLFTTITGEEQAQAFATAQSAMRKEAEDDQALLARAKNNAKVLLERYIINTGKEMGATYSVNWIKEPL